jgi:murein DD-endopeptidase MepM/ murein hydrolase activator NlpD
VNLDAYYERWARVHYYTCPNPSPALTPLVAQRMLDDLHHEARVDWSWGGLYEKRNHLWRGGYMKEKRAYIHLGVDFNVPEGTGVCSDLPSEVVLVDNDIGEVGGWGTRVVVRLLHHPIVLIYAHLARNPGYMGTTLRTGDRLYEEQPFGRVGAATENGGWFPHLHLQALTAQAWDYFSTRLGLLDGYGREEDMRSHMARFPDPMPYVRLS